MKSLPFVSFFFLFRTLNLFAWKLDSLEISLSKIFQRRERIEHFPTKSNGLFPNPKRNPKAADQWKLQAAHRDMTYPFPTKNKKDIAPLRLRRLRRRRLPGLPEQDNKRVSAICVCEYIDVSGLSSWLEMNSVSGQANQDAPSRGSLEDEEWFQKVYLGNIVHITNKPQPTSTDEASVFESARASQEAKTDGFDIFIYPYGCVVFWGLQKSEEERFLTDIQPFFRDAVTPEELEDSKDTFSFVYNTEAPTVKHDLISLKTSKTKERMAVSYALAQSAKLSVFEDRVFTTIRKTRHIPKGMAATGKINMKEEEINQLIGAVFNEINEINLYSDILDLPEFLWESDTFEPVYNKIYKYLQVNSRLEVLNKRLVILRELLDVLNSQVESSHATKLEVIIIWLIVVEVIKDILWDVLIEGVFHWDIHM